MTAVITEATQQAAPAVEPRWRWRSFLRHRIGIVGDRADTDLAGGAAKGWTTILLLSGVTAAADVPRLERRPDVVLGGLADLVA
jgi:ribonucleotide monophosphatase NagD (HAD superfamily)